MLALSETWGRKEKPCEVPQVDGYIPWNSERGGSSKGGGGLTMLYRDTLRVHKHTPPVPEYLQYLQDERQWLLITNAGAKCAFLHCYIACQTTRNDNYLKWNEDLFFLLTEEIKVLKRQGFMILALGDFNSRVGQLTGLEANHPDTNHNAPMFFDFLHQTNLLIINTLPIAKGTFTRFMDSNGTRSLLDYGLIDANQSSAVSSFVIDDQARYSAGSDHALLECSIVMRDSAKIIWSHRESLQYNIDEGTNFDPYKASLDSAMSHISMHRFSQMTASEMLPHITENINSSAKKTIGLKVDRRRRGRRLPAELLQELQQKNSLLQSIDFGDNSINTENLIKQYKNLKELLSTSIDHHIIIEPLFTKI